jgi:hypothetical protein
MVDWAFPWDSKPAPATPPLPPDPAAAPVKRRGRRPAAGRHSRLLGTAAPVWLYHHLTIRGPAETVAAFAAAARGAGVIPWRLDGAGIEDDVFIRAVSQPASRRHLTIDGCRILARQFRERAEARHAQAVALLGQSRACPFDLQVLLPVPAVILQLGPSHPAALAWLAAHWGITDRLRQVVARPKPSTGRRLPKGHAVIGYGFFTDGETPQAGIAQLAAQWPGVRFSLVPRPAD